VSTKPTDASHLAFMSALNWRMWRADPTGSAAAPKPEGQHEARWNAALLAEGLHVREVDTVRFHAATLSLPAGTMGQNGHNVADLRHAVGMLLAGHTPAAVRSVAQPLLNTGPKLTKDALHQRASRLLKRAKAFSGIY